MSSAMRSVMEFERMPAFGAAKNSDEIDEDSMNYRAPGGRHDPSDRLAERGRSSPYSCVGSPKKKPEKEAAPAGQ